MTAAPVPFALDTAEFRLVAAACVAAATGGVAALGSHGRVDPRTVAALVDRHRLGAPVVTMLADALDGRDAAVAAALSSRLDQRGIPHLVVKGAVLSQQLYGDVAARSSKDIDLLVDRADLDRAGLLVEEAGFARTDGEVGGPRRHRSYAAGAIQIELHDRLIDLPSYVPLEFDALWSRRIAVDLLGREIATLGDVDTLLYLAAHGSDHVWFRLKWLQDIARIVARDPGGRVAMAGVTAQRVGFDRVFATMLRLVAELFGLRPLPDFASVLDDRATRRAVRLARDALAAPAELAHVPTLGWIVRRSTVQLAMRRDWRYRRDLIADLVTGPRSFDSAERASWSLLHLPVRAVRFWRTRA